MTLVFPVANPSRTQQPPARTARQGKARGKYSLEGRVRCDEERPVPSDARGIFGSTGEFRRMAVLIVVGSALVRLGSCRRVKICLAAELVQTSTGSARRTQFKKTFRRILCAHSTTDNHQVSPLSLQTSTSQTATSHHPADDATIFLISCLNSFNAASSSSFISLSNLSTRSFALRSTSSRDSPPFLAPPACCPP